MSKTFSVFRLKIYLAFLLLLMCCAPVSAILDPDLYLEKSFSKIPVEIEEKLNKKLDLSFNAVQLSEILVLMAKMGDFNIVFPKELDQTVTMQIKDQSIKNTLEDIALLYNYEYEFKNSSVVFKNKNLNEHVELIPIKYLSAALVLNMLEPDHIEGVKLNKDPALNNILATGKIESIREIEAFIKSIDKAPKQKIFLPEFLTYKDIQRFLNNNLNEKADIAVNRIEQNYILLSGKEVIVNDVYARLEELDKPISEQAFNIQVYSFDENFKEVIQGLEPLYQKKTLFRIDADLIDLSFLTAINSKELKLFPESESFAFEMKFKFNKDILDLDTIHLNFNEKETFINRESDVALYYLEKKDLKKNNQLKQALGLIESEDLIFVIRAKPNHL